VSEAPLLEVRDVRMQFVLADSMLRRARRVTPEVLRAVDGVDLEIAKGEALGLVGESGCGKSTLGRCIVGLYTPTGGEIRYSGEQLKAKRKRSQRRRMQMVFQDPYSSLNPRMTVRQVLSELLRVHDMVPKNRVDERCRELIELVGLGPRALDAHPRNFSGGQRQRVSIARALALEPELLVADEPVSALDVSVQATVLNLLDELRTKLGLTMLFIAHNMAVVRHVCDRVAVMYLGRIVEAAAMEGDPPSPINVPSGCRFHTRCPIAQEICHTDDPTLAANGGGHLAACHFAWTAPPPAHVPEVITEAEAAEAEAAAAEADPA
jgi:peptide/nickel transport system ATP-binding protein